MLQVENVFHLQVIGEGQDTQLSLSWRTLDEKRKEEDYCRSCGTYELREMIGGLVEKLVGEKSVEVVVEKKPIVVVKKKQKGVLYTRLMGGKWKWFEYGNEKKDRKYVGEIENGEPNGRGIMTFPDGRKYVGEFKDKPNGQGTYTYPHGEKYVGEIKDGSRHGYGTNTWNNGQKYEGEYKYGKYHGEGTMFLPDGGKIVGEFRNQRPWNSVYDKNGYYLGRYVNGIYYRN